MAITKKGNPSPTNEKKFNPSIGFWPTKSGKGFSVFLSAKVMKEIEQAQEGGSLFLQEVPDAGDSDNKPHYRVVIFPPSDQTGSNSDSL